MQEYFEINKNLWNQKVAIHLNTELYGMDSFMAGRNSLDEATLELLGDVKGKSVLHLQCHFGQDSLSLARMGAKVTAIDLSDAGIKKARELNAELNLDVEFICCNVYDLKDHLEQKFDIVYTSFGTIVWLPDLTKWADIIRHFLAKNGKFVFLDFHPVVDMLNWDTHAFEYDYFNPKKPYIETNQGTYADKNADVNLTECFWSHSLAEVVQALLDQELRLESMSEYDYSPYNVFGEMVKKGEMKYTFKNMDVAFPYFYALVCSN